MDGWISLHRKFLLWEWYDDINTKSLFIHCLLKSNHDKKEWRGLIIKRGQFFTSIDHLSKELNLSNKQIRLSISKLKKTKEIDTKGHNNGTMITICKYDSYQEIQKTKGKRRANGGQTEDKRRATNNNDNNDNNYNNEINIKDVKSYFEENGYNENSAITFFNYYKNNDWKDSNGNKVKNWKNKARNIWFKDENKIKPKTRKYAVDCGDRILYFTKEKYDNDNMAAGGYKIDLNKWKDE